MHYASLKKAVVLFGTLMLLFSNVQAATPSETSSSEQERIYLVQLVNQLNAMLPTVKAAQRQQPRNARIQFHYSAYQDANGQAHNGLLEDRQTIKQGIEEKLDTVTVEPRVIQPIRGDYLDRERQ